MKRLVKKSEYSEKWTVNFSAEDGFYQEPFSTREQAVEYMEKQTGFDLKNKTDQELKHVVDNWGRSFELALQKYDDCQVCKKKNVPIVRIKGVNSCFDCWDDYECGGWDIDKNGNIKKEESKSFNMFDEDEDGI